MCRDLIGSQSGETDGKTSSWATYIDPQRDTEMHIQVKRQIERYTYLHNDKPISIKNTNIITNKQI